LKLKLFLAELKKNAPIVDESEIVEEVVEEKKVERENPFGKDDETTSTENIEGVFVRFKIIYLFIHLFIYYFIPFTKLK